jgi:hypothetical protein
MDVSVSKCQSDSVQVLVSKIAPTNHSTIRHPLSLAVLQARTPRAASRGHQRCRLRLAARRGAFRDVARHYGGFEVPCLPVVVSTGR